MIQEINPDYLDNTFPCKKPEAEDIAVVYSGGRFLLKMEQERRRFLSIGEVFENKEATEEAVPLFKIGDKTWYLIEDSKVSCRPDWVWETDQIFRRKKMRKAESFGGMTALHIINWSHSADYCGICGAKTVWDKKLRKKNCPACGNEIFPRINPAVIVAVYDGDELLMSKYSGRQSGKYVLIAGFVEIGETLEEACRREVYEETGIRIKNIRYFRSQPWGYSDSLLAGFFAELQGDRKINVDKTELSEACWIKREDIDAVDEDFSLTNAMIMEFKRNDIEKG